MKRQRLFYTFISVLLIASGVLCGVIGFTYAYTNKIAPGVTVLGQSLTGLTVSQATAKLEPVIQELLATERSFVVNDYEQKARLTDIGYTLHARATAEIAYTTSHKQPDYRQILAYASLRKPQSSPLISTVDEAKLQTFLDSIREKVDEAPKDLSLDYVDGAVVLVPAEDGIILNEQSVTDFLQAQHTFRTADALKLPHTKVPAQISDPAQVYTAETFLIKVLAKPVKIEVQDGSTTIPYEINQDTLFDMIIFSAKDNQLQVTFDETKVKEQVEDIAKKVEQKAITKVVLSSDNSTISEGKDGRKLNVADATKKLLTYLSDAAFDAPLALAAEKIDRRVATESPAYELGRYEGKYIEIDLSLQKMSLIEGTNLDRQFRVSTGKWSTPTPIGEFQIHNHIPTAWSRRYQLYMDNWMAITANGEYGIHQLPRWPNGYVEGKNHIGQAVSHGCIRLAPGESQYVYDWAPNGTKVIIHQ